MAELEECRRKLVNLKMQKGTASGVHTSVPGSANGSLSPEKPADRTVRLQELKDSIEETKVLSFLSICVCLCVKIYLVHILILMVKTLFRF